jgi:hypothetical protein
MTTGLAVDAALLGSHDVRSVAVRKRFAHEPSVVVVDDGAGVRHLDALAGSPLQGRHDGGRVKEIRDHDQRPDGAGSVRPASPRPASSELTLAANAPGTREENERVADMGIPDSGLGGDVRDREAVRFPKGGSDRLSIFGDVVHEAPNRTEPQRIPGGAP